jgi:hypothetical protein
VVPCAVFNHSHKSNQSDANGKPAMSGALCNLKGEMLKAQLTLENMAVPNLIRQRMLAMGAGNVGKHALTQAQIESIQCGLQLREVCCPDDG